MANKFCSRASENGSLVVWWACERSLSSVISGNFHLKNNFKLQDEKDNELKAWINLKSLSILILRCPLIARQLFTCI